MLSNENQQLFTEILKSCVDKANFAFLLGQYQEHCSLNIGGVEIPLTADSVAIIQRIPLMDEDFAFPVAVRRIIHQSLDKIERYLVLERPVMPQLRIAGLSVDFSDALDVRLLAHWYQVGKATSVEIVNPADVEPLSAT